MTKAATVWLGAFIALGWPLGAGAQCVGDCNGDGVVAINEVITCVNIGLELQPFDLCEPCDADGNRSVAINDIIRAVNDGLTGCGALRSNALAFDGVDDLVAVASAPALHPARAVTVEAWVRVDVLATENGIAGTWNDLVASDRTYLLWIWSGRFEFLVSHDGSDLARATGPAPELGTWQHIAGTYDGDSIRLHVDSVLVGETEFPGPLATNEGPFFIGRTDSGSNGSDYLNGAIDEVRLWSVARTEEEIRESMNMSLSGDEAGLAAYWPLDAGAGDVAFDRTAAANDGIFGDGNPEAVPRWVERAR